MNLYENYELHLTIGKFYRQLEENQNIILFESIDGYKGPKLNNKIFIVLDKLNIRGRISYKVMTSSKIGYIDYSDESRKKFTKIE